MKILVVDDESSIRNLIRMQLEIEGYEVLTAASGKEALERWEDGPDVLILDVMLPDIDGYELLRLFRERDRDIPVLMLTAKSQMNDKLLGLQLGADDYVTKPFNYAELILRVKNMARRVTKREVPQSHEVIRAGEIVVCPKERKVHVNGEEVQLTYREFNLCKLFVSNPQRVFMREELLEKVWGFEYIGNTRAVDIMVQRLRKKLKASGEHIKTIYGVGYKLDC
ncbi:MULTISPECIES: response regulator transcription factor [Bacillus cereus group]|uniref:response regulator transcription factor n=1 Tax=Bacillus cereus group TaxID=86661 RepID=UPI0008642A3D|nr:MULTISPECIES: response regulator transcription factor [Bacillus cereus group]AWC30551.1 DNA-binding response regulator [Bacillus cytotoxicus]AWC42694.1 DNA-binding response regulator [Bacillus cytotoxicus]AWC50625.1 DNA-binding response regulator [Bacillus cytotoxicus]AWC54679.1 DNA-binding response regulator [Bacillus cytotoxicus]AWC58802.1 DNA-binding response regulator [Bacillus cytotoxicus]